MRAGPIIALGLLIGLFIVVSCLPEAGAQDTKVETVTLQEDEYYGFESTELEKDIELTFSFRTDDDVPIDVYLFDEMNYNRYDNGLTASAEKSVTNAASGSAKYRTDEEGVYYIVFDNTDYGPADPDGAVTIHLKVTVDEDDKGPDTLVICGILAVGGIIILFVKAKMNKKKREKRELARAVERIKKEDPAFAVGTAASGAAAAAPEPEDKVACPKCGNPGTFIEQYQRYYCHGCKEYLETEEGVEEEPVRMSCPTCGEEADYIEEYGRHYCYACEHYLA